MNLIIEHEMIIKHELIIEKEKGSSVALSARIAKAFPNLFLRRMQEKWLGNAF